MKLSVVMPVFNEVATLEPILQQVEAVNLADEIVLVDDGSTDGTRELFPALEQRYSNLRIILHETNQGKGAAVRTGIRSAKGELILIQDAASRASV